MRYRPPPRGTFLSDQGDRVVPVDPDDFDPPARERASTMDREITAGPHEFHRRGWRWWLCRHCYAPKELHPRKGWFPARPCHDTRYLSASAPHFREGW